MKCLICLDLDGCLLDDNKQISQATIDCIKQCKELGCIIAFNTTRNFNRVKKYLPLIQPDYVNCLSGCLVRKQNGTELFNQAISNTDLQKVFDITNKYNYLNLVCSEWTESEYVTNQDYAKRHNKKYASIQDIQNIPSYKLIYFFEDTVEQKALEELYSCNVNVVFSNSNKYIRIMPKRDKWDGIKIILDDLKIDDLKIVSFGNDLTDYTTLQNSTFGVAMINSKPELLKSAKHITKYSNNQDGIAIFLKELFKFN